MLVRRSPQMGIDPITAITLVSKGLDFLGNTFGGPSQEQILAAQQQAAAAEKRQIYTGLALVAAGAIVAALI